MLHVYAENLREEIVNSICFVGAFGISPGRVPNVGDFSYLLGIGLPYAGGVPDRGKLSLRALIWHGRGDIRCETVTDPEIHHGRDAIVKVTACAICGSDLHLMGGFVPVMKSGDILSHGSGLVEIRASYLDRPVSSPDTIALDMHMNAG